MLDDIPTMHEFNVKRLLSALLPIIRISASLRDSLVLVLRKALSSRCVARKSLFYLHVFRNIFPVMLRGRCNQQCQSEKQSSRVIPSQPTFFLTNEIMKQKVIGFSCSVLLKTAATRNSVSSAPTWKCLLSCKIQWKHCTAPTLA